MTDRVGSMTANPDKQTHCVETDNRIYQLLLANAFTFTVAWVDSEFIHFRI